MKSREGAQIAGTMQRLTGRRYPKVEQLMDEADQETQLQVIALFRDLESAMSRERNKMPRHFSTGWRSS